MIQSLFWPSARHAHKPANVPPSGTLAHCAPRVVMPAPSRPRLSIHRHPDDLRRTVITGRFAEVCAALEGLAAAEPDMA